MEQRVINEAMNRHLSGNFTDLPLSDIRPELTVEHCIKIFDEIIQVMDKHALTYDEATCIALSLAEAFLSGAAELHGNR